jgi:hypothetical protein
MNAAPIKFATLIVAALTFTMCLVGCGSDEADIVDTKGVESALPGAEKDDSFRKPTDHGTLTFGVDAQSELTEDERFHVWNFTLTERSVATIRTEPVTANLDTVMYLYRRDESETNWGRYLKRNDDHDKSIWSQITFEADAGEYRVLIKGYKSGLRGKFNVRGECAGDGCPSVGGSDIYNMPTASASFNASCYAKVSSAATASVVRQEGLTVNYEAERASLDGIAQKPVDFYAEYWQGFGYWEDMDWNGEGHDLNVSLIIGEDGAQASVDAGGGEDTLTLLLDGTDTIEEPSEYCFGAFLNFLPHNDDDTRELNGAATAKNAADTTFVLDAMARVAVTNYANNVGVKDDAEIRFEGISWEPSDNWGTGATLTLSTEGATAVTYELATSEWETWIFTATDATNTTRFLCEESN